jgi:hypothetical protein
MMSQTQTIHSLPMKGVNTAASFDTTNHQESLSVPESRLPFKFSFLSFFLSFSHEKSLASIDATTEANTKKKDPNKILQGII